MGSEDPVRALCSSWERVVALSCLQRVLAASVIVFNVYFRRGFGWCLVQTFYFVDKINACCLINWGCSRIFGNFFVLAKHHIDHGR